MNAALAPEDRLVQYLLGRMPEQERVELEERLFEDEDLDEQLLATTDELIHSYLVGALPEEDRSRFETYFLASPENREQLALMKDVLQAVERPSPSPRSRAWALAAAAVVLLAVAVALVAAARWMGQRDDRATASPLPAASRPPSAESRRESPIPRVPEPPRVHVVRLPARSGAPVRVSLSPSTGAVRVEVPVDQESPSFDAAVLAADGTAVWRAEGRAAPAAGEPLVLEVPARILASGRYTLRVEGESLREAVPPVLEYRLQVVRER